MIPLLQSTGTASCCYTKLHTLVRWGIVESAVFSNSAWILSTPADLPFFNWRTAMLTSFLVISSNRTGSCPVLFSPQIDICWEYNTGRWFWAVQYVMKVLLPSFSCSSWVLQISYLLVWLAGFVLFACEILYKPGSFSILDRYSTLAVKSMWHETTLNQSSLLQFPRTSKRLLSLG